MVDENGYFADVARTIVVGESSKAKHDLVRLCRETTDFIARTAVPGKRGKEWLQETREFVKQRIATGNYDMSNPEPIMFLGHSIGLDMNSYYFGPDADMELKENMSLALEAWLYVPQIGAVRFEELIIIKNEGAQFLTKYRYTP
jgi:Xaa-Pro dipeptidase